MWYSEEDLKSKFQNLQYTNILIEIILLRKTKNSFNILQNYKIGFAIC